MFQHLIATLSLRLVNPYASLRQQQQQQKQQQQQQQQQQQHQQQTKLLFGTKL